MAENVRGTHGHRSAHTAPSKHSIGFYGRPLKAPEVAVYCAVTIDGYIAGTDGSVDFLNEYMINLEGEDLGWKAFISSVDVLVLGRNSYEKVLSFDCEWPYKGKRVIVLSSTLDASNGVPALLEQEPIEFFHGNISLLMQRLREDKARKIYVDGGMTIQQFMEKNLVDSMVLSVIPVVLSGGIPLFSNNPSSEKRQKFELISSKAYPNGIVQNRYHFKGI